MSNGLLNASGLTTPKITTEEIILRGKPISDAINGGGEFRITAPHALGDFYFSITSHMPDDVLPLNGSEVSRVTYSDLYNYVLNIHNELVASGKKFIVSEEEWQNISIENNGYVPYYSYGTGDGLFRLPRMSGYLKATGELDEAGNYVAEGLPNPQLEFLFREDGASSGVYTDIYGYNGPTLAADSGTTIRLKETDGSDEYMKSNADLENTKKAFDIRVNEQIYGNSEHVTPETNTLFVGVWALSAFTQVGTANLNEIKEIIKDCEAILGDSLPLLSSRYDNKGLETSVWKLSDGRWFDGRIYTDAYNKILQRITEGDTVCLEMKESELLSSNEFPENFLIDTEGVKFRLPLFVANERTIIKEWREEEEWYRIWSDGYLEQGGSRQAMTSDSSTILNFRIPFINTNYTFLQTTKLNAVTTYGTSGVCFSEKTTTSIKLLQDTHPDNGGIWTASGYIDPSFIPPRKDWEIDFNYYFKVSHGVDEGTINIEEKLTEFEETAYTRLNELVEEVSKDYVVHVDKQVGELYFSFDNYCPDGVIPLDGRLVSRATYADLWEWVQEKGLVKDDTLITTNDENTVSIFNEDGTVKYCSWYGSGDGELTFRVPKINGYIKASGDNTSVGQYIAEGLPNITGSLTHIFTFPRKFTSDGAFVQSNSGASSKDATGSSSYWSESGNIIFSANDSNPIYGNSEHVTPETNTLFVGVWAITASKAAVFDMRDVEEALKSAESYLMNNVPLMSSRWDRDGLGNLGWVKADGSWVDGKTYTGAYNYCVEKLVSGHEDFIDGQVSAISEENFDKFIVDRIGKRFRLPITNGQRTWEEVQGLNNPTWVLYFKLAHEFYAPAQAVIQEKLDLIDNLVVKTDINLPTLSSRWDNDFAENIGWVKSEGQWLNGNVYRDAYDLMVSRIGVHDKFIEAAEGTEITDDDVDKFLIDTSAVKFRLPLIWGERTLVSTYKNDNEWYNLYSDGWIEQGGKFSVPSNPTTLTLLKEFKDLTYTVTTTGIRTNEQNTGNVVITTRKTNSISFYTGDDESFNAGNVLWRAIGYTTTPSISDYNRNTYLFFKLADEVPSTVVNTQQIINDLKQECDDFKEELQNKFNSGAFVIETFRSEDGKLWYRVWSDGWIEQGGVFEGTSHITVITFLVPFTNINWSYYVGGEYYTDSTGTPVVAIVVNTKSVTGAKFQCRWNGTAATINSTIPKSTWYACGY